MDVCLNARHGGRVKTGAWINGSSSCAETYLKPIYKHGEVILEVECGENKGLLYLSRLCQGSRGPCILFDNNFLTPNEFQYISGRETAKDWKRSIRHHGKSIKLLLSKGLLCVHPTICDCPGCKTNGQLGRHRSTFKRTHKACKYDVVFPTNEPMFASDATSSDKEENNSDGVCLSPRKLKPQRASKLSQIIENLRSSREKENISARDNDSEAGRERVDYSAEIHFHDMRRSPSISPNLVYTPTIEQLNWTGFSYKSEPVHSPPVRSFSWKSSFTHALEGRHKKRAHEEATPLDLSIKKLKPGFDYDESNSKRLESGRSGCPSPDGSYSSRSPSQSPSLESDTHVSPSIGRYHLKVPSVHGKDSIPLDSNKDNCNNNECGKDTPRIKLEKQTSSVSICSQANSHDSKSSDNDVVCHEQAKYYAMDDWEIDDVANFVKRICESEDIVQKFRDQHVDGRSLRLLTVDHLVGVLSIKLGPAVRLRAEISKQCGMCEICQHCVHCHSTGTNSESGECS